MARILLAHSYFLRFDTKAWKQSRPYPPLGTLYAAAVLRQAGHEVTLFDPMFAHTESEIVPILERFKPAYTIFHEDNFHYLSKMCLSRMREACMRMSEHARHAGSRVIAQGSDPVDHIAEYVNRGVDVVACREAEATLPELIDALERTPPGAGFLPMTRFGAIDGIAFAIPDGIQVTPARALIQDLDALPFPAWDLVDMGRYRKHWIRHHGSFSLNLVTTRGCPYHCNWCAKPVYGQVYNSRSPENLVAEMRYLKETFDPDHIWFCDDIMGLKPGWLKRFADLLDAQGWRIPFMCQTRADLMLKENNVRDIARAGAHTVWLGVESGSQRILDAMQKGLSIDDIRMSTERLQEHGIRVAWFLQFGYLGEESDDIAATLDLLHECKPDDIGISVSYPLPGTPFHDTVREQMGKKRNWVDSGDLDLMFPGTYHPDYYRALHATVHRTFRIRQTLRGKDRGSAGALFRGLLAFPYHAVHLAIARVRMSAARKRGTATNGHTT